MEEWDENEVLDFKTGKKTHFFLCLKIVIKEMKKQTNKQTGKEFLGVKCNHFLSYWCVKGMRFLYRQYQLNLERKRSIILMIPSLEGI